MATMTLVALDSPAVAILSALERDGFRVELEADNGLVISPRSRLTPERMQAITACKDALTTLLRWCDAGVQARRDAFEQQLAATPAPGCPAFVFRPDVPYTKGTCFSCAAPLHELRFGRCWRCSLAWRLVCRLPVPPSLADAIDGAKVVG